MDGRITGVDLRWGKDVAYTQGLNIRHGRLIREGPTAHIAVQIVCNECGAEHELRLEEMIPNGILALSMGEKYDGTED